ncbi:MAG: ATP-dependent 6-phosphofructokinase [Spirochaetes bacterium]|nr:MAG: ATP-dependent 6-phosphofructokinase [Spirochaetota bacterium]
MNERINFSVPLLGERKVVSPIKMSTILGDLIANYVGDDEFILYDVEARPLELRQTYRKEELLEKAGPREMIYFKPEEVHAGIVTCGGLCPGLNDVIRAIVNCLWYRYGVKNITGIRYGYKGFLKEYDFPVISLNSEMVENIHKESGTILGSSRGGGDRTEEIVDAIERLGLNILFTIGGDGTQKGAIAIAEEVERRGKDIAIVGVPKTIDNDLSFVQKSFGFETAVSRAVEAVYSAHSEAKGAINGVGIVKVMGRESGFIAAHTALATGDTNFVLIPEIPFDLYGRNGLFRHLRKRLETRHHAVILVAEGAGQDLLKAEREKDESGNIRFGDIGLYLKTETEKYFENEKMEVTIKYIDPSYMIRSIPASPGDSIYCARLGTNAVHAAMAGRTKTLISLVNNTFVHLPMEMAVSRRNRVDPEGPLWRDVLEATGQPVIMKNGR